MASPAPYGATKDAFCGGHAHDDLGRVIFQGGLLGYGVKTDPASTTRLATMPRPEPGRSSVPPRRTGIRHSSPVHGTCSSFRAAPLAATTTSGKPKDGTSAWADTGKRLIAMNTYPRVALLPDGRFFVASPAADEDGQLAGRNYFYDPVINNRSLAGNDVVPDSGGGVQRRAEHDVRVSTIHDDWSGTGVLLPLTPSQQGYDDFKFALIGGNEAHVKDLSVGSRPGRRWAHGRRRWIAAVAVPRERDPPAHRPGAGDRRHAEPRQRRHRRAGSGSLRSRDQLLDRDERRDRPAKLSLRRAPAARRSRLDRQRQQGRLRVRVPDRAEREPGQRLRRRA